MFKFIIPVFAFVLLAILNFTDATFDAPPTGYSTSDEVSNSIYFSLNSYKTLFNANDNFVFSPFSLRVIYNTLFQVAYDNAESKLKPVLFENYGLSRKDSVLYGQGENLLTIAASPNVKVANKLYYPDGLHLSMEIVAMSRLFQSEYEHVDFTQQQATISTINNWVENRTNGLIRDLVDSSIVKPDTQLLFVNTVYFKAKWLKAFDRFDQMPYTFNSIDGTTKTIDFIADQSFYPLAFLNQFKVDVLELPYERASGFVFWILLPNSDSSIEQLKSTLNKLLFKTIQNSLHRTFSNIKFPIFEIESELDGKSIAPEAFLNPDFQVGAMRSKVDIIKQKAKIIVNLDGTEAAAATTFTLVPISAMVGPNPKQFIADRPFIYTVIHKNTLQPIFIGHFGTA